MHLYLIRHGQSYVNLKDWQGGNTDEGLTELGQRQVAALAAWLPQGVPHIDALYVSTMRRAQETAKPISALYAVKPHFDERLREIGNNRRDHSAFPSDGLPQQFADYWASERPFSTIAPAMENGETFMHFRARVGLLIEELLQEYPGKTVMLVCHGGVIEAAFDHIYNVGPWRRCEVWTHNTAVSYFEYVAHPRREAWRLHFHNRVDHLTSIEGPSVAAQAALEG